MSVATAGIYEELGVRRLINAQGHVTALGGSLMPQPVIDAMVAASRSYVTLRELQEKAGQRIAELVGVESAIVSSGAAGGILLAAAACLAGKDPEKILRLPNTEGWRNEFVVARANPNYMYQAIAAAGGRLVQAGTAERLDAEDFARAIGDRTAAVFLVVAFLDDRHAEGRATATISSIARVARERGVPVIVDAAAELPPASNFRRFLEEGGDLAVFSGGKAIRGPQPTGIVVGRRDLIEAAHASNNPLSTIGRPCKVGKEEIVGLVRAVELYVQRDEAAELRDWEARMRRLAAALEGIPGVEALAEAHRPWGRPPIVTRCFVRIDETTVGLSKADVVRRLREGDPSVAIGTYPEGLLVHPGALDPTEDEIVAARLRAVLAGAR